MNKGEIGLKSYHEHQNYLYLLIVHVFVKTSTEQQLNILTVDQHAKGLIPVDIFRGETLNPGLLHQTRTCSCIM